MGRQLGSEALARLKSFRLIAAETQNVINSAEGSFLYTEGRSLYSSDGPNPSFVSLVETYNILTQAQECIAMITGDKKDFLKLARSYYSQSSLADEKDSSKYLRRAVQIIGRVSFGNLRRKDLQFIASSCHEASQLFDSEGAQYIRNANAAANRLYFLKDSKQGLSAEELSTVGVIFVDLGCDERLHLPSRRRGIIIYKGLRALETCVSQEPEPHYYVDLAEAQDTVHKFFDGSPRLLKEAHDNFARAYKIDPTYDDLEERIEGVREELGLKNSSPNSGISEDYFG
ncbi:hypothetical protein HN876_01255 [archaeon]|jgi:hypothetical protein|nr:hypothetical protein [archaeon]MBT7251527.1 hypothetical protein [archaeon]